MSLLEAAFDVRVTGATRGASLALLGTSSVLEVAGGAVNAVDRVLAARELADTGIGRVRLGGAELGSAVEHIGGGVPLIHEEAVVVLLAVSPGLAPRTHFAPLDAVTTGGADATLKEGALVLLESAVEDTIVLVDGFGECDILTGADVVASALPALVVVVRVAVYTLLSHL
jgi:hypothetical protein